MYMYMYLLNTLYNLELPLVEITNFGPCNMYMYSVHVINLRIPFNFFIFHPSLSLSLSDKKAAETELSTLQVDRDSLSTRSAALEGEVKRLRRELEEEKEKTAQMKEAEVLSHDTHMTACHMTACHMTTCHMTACHMTVT